MALEWKHSADGVDWEELSASEGKRNRRVEIALNDNPPT